MTRNIYYFLLYFYLTLFYMTDQTAQVFYVSEDEDSELSYYSDSESSQSSNNDDPINDITYSPSQDSTFYSDED